MTHHRIDSFRRRADDLGKPARIFDLLQDPFLDDRSVTSFVRRLGLEGEEPAPVTPDDVRQPSHHVLTAPHLEAEGSFESKLLHDFAAKS